MCSKQEDQTAWLISINTSRSDIDYKIDTGAQANIIPQSLYYRLRKKPKLRATKEKLFAYDGSEIPVVGKCIAKLNPKGKADYSVQFVVVSIKSCPMLGLETCQRLNLIKRIWQITQPHANVKNVPEEYSEAFGEIGCLSGELHISLTSDAIPVVHLPRKVPYLLKDKLKKELDRMGKNYIIDHVDESTDWVNSMVIVEKRDGKLRICLDPHDLNKAIKKEHYSMQSAESIMADMAGAKYFSKLDASSVYWQIKVDEESSKLLAFNTSFGRYKYKRLPFGILSASEVFQKKISQIIEGISSCVKVQDDIIVRGKTKHEHYLRFAEKLDMITKSGIN